MAPMRSAWPISRFGMAVELRLWPAVYESAFSTLNDRHYLCRFSSYCSRFSNRGKA